MKNKSIRVALATVIFGALLWSLACNSGKQVSNQDQSSASRSDTAELTKGPCTVSSVQNDVNSAIGANNVLNFQRSQGKFDITVQNDSSSVISMTIKGKVIGEDENSAATLKGVFKAIEKHVRKGCVQRVYFEPAGTTTTAARGFEWQLCESPAVSCPDGSCSNSGCTKEMNTNTSTTTEPGKDSNSSSSNTNKIN
ncbi:MAG: hypothetical protein ABI791_09585 [Acidobacteriota bacterium]